MMTLGFDHRLFEPLDHFVLLIASGAEALSGGEHHGCIDENVFSRLTD
jgi:hypothetical protein